MSEKKLKTRIQQKTDTKANWDKAANFVPLKGEYIYYSDINMVKVGDGVKKLSELPFVTSINDIANGFNLNSQSDIVWNYSGHQDDWTHVPLPWNYGGLHWGDRERHNAAAHRIDLFPSERDSETLDLIVKFSGDYTDAIKITQDISGMQEEGQTNLTLGADGWITCKGITVKNDYGNSSITVGNKTVLTDHQPIKTLKTDNTAAQTPSANESIAGSGVINLHKVSKTGSYNDLNDKPVVPTSFGLKEVAQLCPGVHEMGLFNGENWIEDKKPTYILGHVFEEDYEEGEEVVEGKKGMRLITSDPIIFILNDIIEISPAMQQLITINGYAKAFVKESSEDQHGSYLGKISCHEIVADRTHIEDYCLYFDNGAIELGSADKAGKDVVVTEKDDGTLVFDLSAKTLEGLKADNVYKALPALSAVPYVTFDDFLNQRVSAGCAPVIDPSDDASVDNMNVYAWKKVVTSVASGEGLTGGPITTEGTISHAVPSGAEAKPTGLYKVGTDKFGHVTSMAPVTKADITNLGIPDAAQQNRFTFTAGSGISIETSDDGNVKISCSYSDGDTETY